MATVWPIGHEIEVWAGRHRRVGVESTTHNIPKRSRGGPSHSANLAADSGKTTKTFTETTDVSSKRWQAPPANAPEPHPSLRLFKQQIAENSELTKPERLWASPAVTRLRPSPFWKCKCRNNVWGRLPLAQLLDSYLNEIASRTR